MAAIAATTAAVAAATTTAAAIATAAATTTTVAAIPTAAATTAAAERHSQKVPSASAPGTHKEVFSFRRSGVVERLRRFFLFPGEWYETN